MIRIYSKNEIQIMRDGGRILAKIMKELEERVKPGITTKELNKVASDLIFSFGAQPSFKGYDGFPAVLCTSINEEVVHAVPKDRELKKGDVLSLDLGIRYKGYCSDLAITVSIGNVDKKIKKLIGVTKDSLEMGIEQLKPGNSLNKVGAAIQKYVEKNGFNVIRELVGHGIGKQVHEDPQIPNYKGSQDIELKQGMVLALEPMVTVGDWHVKKSKDGFGYITEDDSLSAHFEHTIAITDKEPLILTRI